MGKIVAIGGGEISENETLEIDRAIVRLTGKLNPSALFIPTASGEPDGYIESFEKVYGGLGCITSTLKLIGEELSEVQIREKILSSDIIYVGGGDTERMLDIWKSKNVDKFLAEAYQNDIVLSGLSAGSICWFKYGHSDSLTYRTGEQQNFFKLEGLGFAKGIHCPHYTEEARQEDFDAMVSADDEMGIALDDHCAIEINNVQFKILKSKPEAKAYKVFIKDGHLIKKELTNIGEYLPLELLYSKN